MTTPKTTKQAMENDMWIVKKIYAKGSQRIRVDFQKRLPDREGENFVSFWIDRDYFERNYPQTYAAH